MPVKVAWLVDIKAIKRHHFKKRLTTITIALKNSEDTKFGTKLEEIQLSFYTELPIMQILDQIVKQQSFSRHQNQGNLMG